MISLIQGRDKAKLGKGEGNCPFEMLPINEMAEKKGGCFVRSRFLRDIFQKSNWQPQKRPSIVEASLLVVPIQKTLEIWIDFPQK
ncbi:hypothetical protein CDAR_91931 [Caerostris darwini]|uniref:Uncharacterized protein n=1 Tax=Caerostris darwini TaxID=1538125 RepID=A0AAV4QR61_9ARAC|nr:hypothetical protein CDAR_91931 [Caerostris darwini]